MKEILVVQWLVYRNLLYGYEHILYSLCKDETIVTEKHIRNLSGLRILYILVNTQRRE